MTLHLTALLLAVLTTLTPTLAQTVPVSTPRAAPLRRTDTVLLQAGHGRLVTLPGDAATVDVADPKVAATRPTRANLLFIFGTGVGMTTLDVLDASGALVSHLQVTVLPNSSAANGDSGDYHRMAYRRG